MPLANIPPSRLHAELSYATTFRERQTRLLRVNSMEAVWLGVGAVALAGLFSTCLECFDYVDTAKNFERDSEILVGKLLIQRTRLRRWGELLGLAEGSDPTNRDILTQDPNTEAAVRLCLERI